MEDSHATVLDLRKVNAEDMREAEEADPAEKSETISAPTPMEDRISFFAVYDGHGGKLQVGWQ